MTKNKNYAHIFTYLPIHLFTFKNAGLLRFARNDVKDLSSYRPNDLSTNKRKESTTMKKNKNVKKTLEAVALTKRHSEGIRPKNPLHILKRFFAEYKFPFAGNCVKPAQNDGKFLVSFHPLSLPSPSGGEGRNNVKNFSSYRLIDFPTLKKKAAFTLAEVLITLGIIGIVAALTIPGLINNYKAARLRSQFLKSYSIIQQVFRNMEADEVSLDPATMSGGSVHTLFKQYLTGITDCGKGNDVSNKNFKGCYDFNDSTQGYKTMDDSGKINSKYFDDGQLILPDGSLLLIENPNTGATSTYYAWLFVDLNGYNNPPNRWGYDLFTFEFLDGELRTMGDRETTYNDLDKYCNINSTDSFNGIACAHYAKTDSDYFKRVVKAFK